MYDYIYRSIYMRKLSFLYQGKSVINLIIDNL